MVKVEIDIPQNISDFLRHVNRLSNLNIENYMVACITAQIEADLDHVSDTPFWTAEKLREKYGFEE